MIQTNLGSALSSLGERESGTAHLEEAVDAFRAALEECTQERVPLQWAMIQTNLGNVLSRLGERESGTARLEEAVDAIAAAREIYRDAGLVQYEAYCADQIKTLEAEIAALGER